MKTSFRLIDPFISWGNHDYDWFNKEFKQNDFQYDSGFCNRLFTWEIAHRLRELSSDERPILVQRRIFPEFELLKLPNTKVVDYSSKDNEVFSNSHKERLLHLTVFDTFKKSVYKATPINLKEIKSKKPFNFKSNHVYNNWGFYQDGVHDYISNIRIADIRVEKRLQESSVKMIGIHLRRGNGVLFSKKDVETFPKDLRLKYVDYRKQIECVDGIPFISDSQYIKLIEKLLKINPEQQFYLSHDLPDEFVDIFYEKFGKHHIITKKDYRQEFQSYYESKGIDIKSLQNYCNGLDNIIDLFAYSFTTFTIGTIYSTWSEFGKRYSGVKDIDSPSMIGSNIDEVVSSYQEFYNKYKHKVTGQDWLSISKKLDRKEGIKTII